MFGTKTAIQLIKDIEEHNVTTLSDIAIFDWVSPSYIITLASLINWWKLDPKENEHIKMLPEVDTYLKRCNFYAAISSDDKSQYTDNSDNLIEITTIDANDYDLSEMSKVTTKLFVHIKWLKKDNEDSMNFLNNMENSLLYAMTEIVDNIGLHSQADLSQKACMYMLQYFPSTEIARLSVIDNGIGIVESLKDSPHYKEGEDDMYYIQLALQQEITNGKWRGNGLFATSEIVRETNSKMELCSGNILYTQIWQEKEFEYTWTQFPWTLINIEFNMKAIRSDQETQRLEALNHTNNEIDDYDYFDEIFD